MAGPTQRKKAGGGVTVLLACLLLFSAVLSSRADDAVPGQLLVRVNPETGLESDDFLLRRTGQRLGDPGLDRLSARFGLCSAEAGERPGLFLLSFDQGAPDPRGLQMAYLASGLLEASEPNLVFSHSSTLPDDPYYVSSGSWKQSYLDLWGLHAIGTAEAWAVSPPVSEVVIGLVDSGLDFGHPDIGESVWRNTGEVADNGVDDDGNGFVDDVWGYDFTIPRGSPGSGRPLDIHGHGTNSFGIMSADWDNGYGIPGLAFNCRVMVVKGLGDDGNGNLFDLINAIDYAVDNGARVLNLSWGAVGVSDLLEQTIQWADASGVVVVCAAGNSGLPVADVIPASYAETVAVGAVEPDGTIYSRSNHGSALDLVAPGIEILTTRAAYSDPAGDGSLIVGNEFFRSGGTSSAAPHAAAAAGLLLALRDSITPDAVRSALRATAQPFDQGDRVDPQGGYGLLQVGGLLNLEQPVGLKLISPRRGEIISHNLPLSVSARLTGKEPYHWRISFGEEEFPDSFETLAASAVAVQGEQQVNAARPTTGLAPGIYTIRLQAWHPDRPPVYEERASLVIDNSRGRLRGEILSLGTGEPLAAVEVTAFHAGSLETAGIERSGSDGIYGFPEGLPAGLYYVRAGSGFTNVLPQYYDGAASLADADTVEIVAGVETGNIDFNLARRGSISGTISSSDSGEPMSGITVSIYYPAGTLMRQSVSNADGGYHFGNLIPQHYFIGASHAQERFVPRFYDQAGSIDQATPVHVENDNETTGIDLALKRHGGAIIGTVRRQGDQQPLPEIGVTAVKLDSEFSRAGTSGEDGEYQLTDLPSGAYRVLAAGDAGGYRTQYYPEADSPLESITLTLSGSQQLDHVDFLLRPSAFVDISAASPGLAQPLASAVYGLCWRDLDADGDPDLFAAPASGSCRLLRNDPGEGGLADATLELGAAAAGLKRSVSAADLDNDGMADLHLPRYGPFGSTFPDALLCAGADGRYRDAAAALGLVNPPEGIDSCWADFDNNGFADLFVVNLFAPDVLYLNNGDGRFTEVADEAGVTGAVEETNAAASACDMDGDGWTDLLVVVDEFHNSPRKNHLYRNLGNGRFEDVSQVAGLDQLPRSLCAAWGDADNDGDPDLFIGGVEGDALLRNDGAGLFTDVTAGSGIASPYPSQGACWVDANLDGRPDLFTLRYGEAGNRLLLGDGNLQFSTISIDAGLQQPGQWTAYAWADQDLDGDPDLALADAGGRVRLLRNDLADQAAWVSVDLEGRAAPRDGLGAVVTVLDGRQTIVRQVGDLSSPGSRGDRRLLVGLGEMRGETLRAEVRWPSGTLQAVEPLPVNGHLRIVEDVPRVRVVAGTGQLTGNPARIRCYLPGGREVTSARIIPFNSRGHGVEVACGDLDGDGVDEIMAGPGPGPSLAPQVRTFDALGVPLPRGGLIAFSHGGYGVVIASGDPDGDGHDDLAASPGPGPAYGPVVALYEYQTGATGWERLANAPPFLAYSGPNVRGGVRTAFGDLDGDGLDELVTAPGSLAGNGAHIRGWRVGEDGVEGMGSLNFLAYPAGIGYGAMVACGDLDGDGRDELVTAPGPGPGYGPHIKVWRVGGGEVELLTEALLDLPGSRGARIACGDLDGDNLVELVASAGPDGGATSLVRAWRFQGGQLVRVEGAAFHAFEQYGGGAALAVGHFPEPLHHLVK